MHLISVLATGVAGAESGVAELYKRGTSAKAPYYTDFEGTDYVAATTGLQVSLDANGGATVYVDQLVDVVVKDSAGTVIRSFTAGAGASNVEVRSTSFTGTDYQTAQSAVSKPTTLSDVLDAWEDSAGASDWNVDVDGTTLTIAQAAGNSYGVFFNVKAAAYGALGDDSTNDYTAINAAITAAAVAGGIVFFPAGTYRIGTPISLPANVSLLGAGANVSFIKSTSATADVIDCAGSPTYRHFIEGLTISVTQSSTGKILDITTAEKLTVRSCLLGSATLSTAANGLAAVANTAGSEVVFEDCRFLFAGSAGRAIASATNSRTARIYVVRCSVKTPASLTVAGVLNGPNIFARDCLFDAASSTAGTFSWFRPGGASDPQYGSVRGCEFLDSGGSTVTAFELGTLSSATAWFEEDGNLLAGDASNVTLYSATPSTDGYYCKLGTRETRYKEYANTTIGPLELDFLNYGVISVRSTYVGVMTYTATKGPNGAKTSLLVINGDTVTRVITLGTNIKSGATYSLLTTEAAGFEFTMMGPPAGSAWYLTGFSGSDSGSDGYSV